MGQSVEGLEIEANVTKFEFDFHSHDEMISVYNLMSIMCRKVTSLPRNIGGHCRIGGITG